MKKGILLLLVLLLCLNIGCSQTGGTGSSGGAGTSEEAKVTVLTGSADGYGGPITAEVSVDGAGKITALTLTGEKETPEIGGAALEMLTTAILEKGGLNGVDAVSGATWTSNGVFAAINSALGIEAGGTADDSKQLEASDVYQGIGFLSTGRLGPGKDDQEVGVYSFNEVIAYVLFDGDGRILDLEVDQLEVSTPNYDGEYMPNLTGFPGQSYNTDENHDEVVDLVVEQTEDNYLAEVASWITKRERGSTYKLNTGTWEEEMDIFEEFFRGKTMDEIEAWYASSCSNANGRPLSEASSGEGDADKYAALTDEQKSKLDAVSGATMSLNDAHGNIIGALRKAYDNRRPVSADNIAKIGLGVSNVGRLGPGKDDQEVGVYSFNTQAVGICFDSDGKVVAMYTDMIEVATPNYDGEYMPHLTGFPGQSYNADENHDEKVDAVLNQTEETFLAEVGAWQTKRERGSTYKLNSGTWADEMDIFEAHFVGMTADEIENWVETMCSDVNKRPLRATSSNEEDVAKYNALTDEQKADLDAISGATISVQDAHGDFATAISKAWQVAKATNITLQ